MDLFAGLQAFVRVAEIGSFSAVARESATSQSAITRLVGQLEEHFGVRLFHRTTRRLSLTEEGTALLEHGRRLLADADAMQEQVGRNSSQPTGLVRVGLPARADAWPGRAAQACSTMFTPSGLGRLMVPAICGR